MTRPPKPTQLKRLQGTYRSDRANPAEVLPQAPSTFDPPPFLNDRAAEKWLELAPMLARYGLLTEADTDTLTAYVQTWSRWVEAESRIEEEGSTTTARSGYQQVSPWVSIAKTCRADLMKLGDRLGLSPSSRARIPASPAETEDDLLA